MQIDQMKAMCFLLSVYHKRYSFLFNQLSEGGDTGRDEYTATTTLDLDLLIRIEGVISWNQQSTHDNRGNGGYRHQKGRTRHNFYQKLLGGTK